MQSIVPRRLIEPASMTQGIRRLWILRNFLRRVIQREIEMETTKLDMSSWACVTDYTKRVPKRDGNPIVGISQNLCHTAACALGWASVALSADVRLATHYGDLIVDFIAKPFAESGQTYGEYIYTHAADYFGIDRYTAEDLFNGGNEASKIIAKIDNVIAMHVGGRLRYAKPKVKGPMDRLDERLTKSST